MQYRFGISSPEDPKARNAQNVAEHATNYTEYTVVQKPEGKFRTYRFLMVLAYVFYALAFFLFFTAGPIRIPMLVSLLPVTLWILVFFTWRYVSLEYEYILASGVMTFVTVFGGRTRRVLFALPVKDMETVSPLACAEKEIKNADTVLDLRGSVKAAGAYCFTLKDGDGKKTAVLFSATEKALKILKYYNANTVVSPL